MYRPTDLRCRLSSQQMACCCRNVSMIPYQPSCKPVVVTVMIIYAIKPTKALPK